MKKDRGIFLSIINRWQEKNNAVSVNRASVLKAMSIKFEEITQTSNADLKLSIKYCLFPSLSIHYAQFL